MKKLNTYLIITINLVLLPLPILFYKISADDTNRAKILVKNSFLGKFQICIFFI